MTDGPPFEPKGSSRDLLGDILTEEETRHLLLPFPGDGAGSEEVVLLLTDRPEEAERVSAYLSVRSVRTSPVQRAADALQRLRSHDFQAFVMAVDALGATPSTFLEQVYEVESMPILGFIIDAEARIPEWVEEIHADVGRRPLGAKELARLFPWVPEAVVVRGTEPPAASAAPDEFEVRPEEEDPVEELVERAGSFPPGGPTPLGTRGGPGDAAGDPPAPPPPPVGRGPGDRSPDWIGALRLLLTIRSEGGSAIDALRTWAETDPACAGWGTVEQLGGERVLRAGGPDRDALLAALAELLVENPDPPLAPVTRGSFGCLPVGAAWFAIWWRNPGGVAGWERLGQLVPLVDRLQPPGVDGTSRSDGRARGLLIQQLARRMSAARRHGGRLGLLLLEPREASAVPAIADELKPRLRGEDVLQAESSRLWVLLEGVEEGTMEALDARLGRLPAERALRGVGVLWQDGGPEAPLLVDQLLHAIEPRPLDGTVTWFH